MFNKVKWKQVKDMFTLAKNWTEVFKSLIIFYRSMQKERKIFEQLEQYDSCVVACREGQEDPHLITKLVRSLIKQRQKRRNCFVTVLQNALRILMLNYRLDLPLKRCLHPIFVSVCGIVSNLVSIFKIWEKQTSTPQLKLVRVSDMKKRFAVQQLV